MSIEPGNYYFIVAPHAHTQTRAGEHPSTAITAGLKVGDPITVEPHDLPYLERQQWKLIPAADNTFHIESLHLPNHWLGFAELKDGEPMVLSNEPRTFWVFFHPPPSGLGQWTLKVQHEDVMPAVIAQQLPPGKNLTLGFFQDEGLIEGIHFNPERVISDE